MFLSDLLADMDKFMDSGGQVLWAIAVLLFVMWTLIFERNLATHFIFLTHVKCARIYKRGSRIKLRVGQARKFQR